MKRTICLSLTALVLVLGSPLGAQALPSTQSRDDTVDDATITLWVWNQMILGDARSWCEVRIQVVNGDVDFSPGDSVELWVYENDTVGDDQLWTTQFTITAAEVTAGVDRTFDCTTDFGDDVGDSMELYASAEVVKDDCGILCAYDRPSTPNLDVAELTDDSAEEDDNLGGAGTQTTGSTGNRIARDQDWYRLTLAAPSQVTIHVLHDPSVGRIDADLLDSVGQSVIQAGTDGADRTTIDAASVSSGDWYVRYSNRDATDFNFYDLEVTVTGLATTCTPGQTESQNCGRCGTQNRTCGVDGEWGLFGSCNGQGACDPGETVSEDCGRCGSRISRCDDTCAWTGGVTCEGEGPCDPGASEEEVCAEGGTRNRTCTASCNWEPWTVCDRPPLGEPCVTDADCGGLMCFTEGGLFPGGYCSEVGCSGGDCGNEGACVQAFGNSWCLFACGADSDCRPGYLCVAGGCTPPCRDDLDCWDPTPACGAEGRCIGGGGGGGDGGGGGGGPGVQGGCACSATGDGSPAILGLFLLAVALGGRRWTRRER